MAARRNLVPSLLALTALVLAGCAGDGGGGDPATNGEQAPEVEATGTTGGIRGIVVDDRITPIAGATISIRNSDKSAQTGEDGTFAISGLEAGTYLVEATHALYSTSQQSVEVVAGLADPKPVKIQLVRTVFEQPYFNTLQYEGFIVCSLNIIVFLSEECGEGVGVPGMGRVGGQANNHVQFDFNIDNSGIKTMIIEQQWEATSEAGTAFFTPISTEWSCDPVCNGNTFASMEGVSPLRHYHGAEELGNLNLTPDQVVSTFTWASPDRTPAGILLNQQFRVFVSNFYFVPAPEEWSFVGGSPAPF